MKNFNINFNYQGNIINQIKNVKNFFHINFINIPNDIYQFINGL